MFRNGISTEEERSRGTSPARAQCAAVSIIVRHSADFQQSPEIAAAHL